MRLETFGFRPGRTLVGKYEVVGLLGSGWEGEVYLVREISTAIERTAKFFFPERNPRDRTAKFYARKLHKLRHCAVVMQYHTQERLRFRRLPVTFLVSDYLEGERLSDFLERQSGKRLEPFVGLHLLHTIASGLEQLHEMGEYHGDLHSDNVMVLRYGLGFDVKLIDMFYSPATRTENIQADVVDLIRVFYDAIGGQRRYAKHCKEIKAVCCGLKRSLILKKFRTAGQLRAYLETMNWE